MKTIKFRAWDRKNKEMVYLELKKSFVDVYLEGMKQDGSTLDERKEGLTPWMQFTNLLDKNGKEIYEGDILRSKMGNREFIGTMYFNQEKAQFGFDSEIETKKNIPDHFELHSKPEIIGNIYENPDLLLPPSGN